MQYQSNESILEEIFIKPSNDVLSLSEEAKCSGRCESGGGCKPFLEIE